MNKIIFFLLLSITNLSFSQKINTEGNGYTEIVKADSLTKTEIYNKLTEWISLNYKSANDVIQLDRKDKIIVKGNFVFNYNYGKSLSQMRVTNLLMFSIKDNRYKIDLNPTDIYNPDYPDTKNSPFKDRLLKTIISKEYLNREEYKKFTNEIAKQTYIGLKLSDKEIKKIESYMTEDLLNETYLSSLDLYNNFTSEIKNIFTSIKNAVSKKDEW